MQSIGEGASRNSGYIGVCEQGLGLRSQQEGFLLSVEQMQRRYMWGKKMPGLLILKIY